MQTGIVAFKDASALGLIAGSVSLLVNRAMDQDDALSRAAERAVSGAVITAPLAMSAVFTLCKKQGTYEDRKHALEYTAIFGGGAAIAGAALAGIGSLFWDAVRR